MPTVPLRQPAWFGSTRAIKEKCKADSTSAVCKFWPENSDRA